MADSDRLGVVIWRRAVLRGFLRRQNPNSVGALEFEEPTKLDAEATQKRADWPLRDRRRFSSIAASFTLRFVVDDDAFRAYI